MKKQHLFAVLGWWLVLTSTFAQTNNAPSNLVASAQSSSQINLTWKDNSTGESGFEIEISTDNRSFSKIADADANATSYQSTGLKPTTRYYYRIRASLRGGPTPNSNTADATTLPVPTSTVTDLKATAKSTTSIELTWTDIGKEAEYYLERRTGQSGRFERIASTTVGYTDNNRTPATEYCYRIMLATYEAAPYSSIVCATTQAPPIAKPNNPARLTATAVSPSQINLQWADVSDNETGFELERSTDGASFQKIADLGANATSYSDPNLQPRTQYFYRILAKNAAGSSTYSNVADATTPDAPPATPARLAATAVSPNQINLQWADVSDNETGFQLEQSPDGAIWKKIADLPANTTTHQHTGLNPATKYFYRVKATNAVGESGFSNTADATTQDKPLTPPVAPARLTATAVSATQINLVWADLSDNESGFMIERSANGTSDWTKVGDAAANATSFQNTGLQPVTKYFYRILATNVAGQSAFSNIADATTPDVAPVAPARLMATATSAVSVTLSWADLSGNETGFEIERGRSETGTFSKLADVAANVTTYEDRGLTPAEPYCYRIRARNAIGASDFSNAACVTTPNVPPAAPARLTATAVAPTQINLAWADLSTNESGFEIERGSSATGSFTKIADVAPNATTYEDKNRVDNTTYCYRVRAKNAAGVSGFTDAVCATTPLAPPAVPGTLVAQLADYDQVLLTWPVVSSGTVTVAIERSTDPNAGFTEIAQQPAAQTNYLDTGLQEFTTYYYRIRAVNPAGKSGYSNVANVRIEEIIIAVEDEWATHTFFSVSQKTLQVNTNWFQPTQTTIQLITMTGQVVLTDTRKVHPADVWTYSLDRLPTGIYLIALVADGRSLTKRFLLP
ncbi:fibronectin type III domain-containing protein [Larkinella humicola]|nr:fibronectin type III domain-containing protein [Larkinella humicola]